MVVSNTYYYVTTWFLLHVYVLVDVLDFIILFYQSRVFEYILVYSGWGGGGGCCIYLQNVCMYAEKTALGG